MNEWERLTRNASLIKEQYPKGTRILLIEMGDDPNPIPPNTRGTVDFVDDIGTVFAKFDNGRSLGMAYGEDHYRKLTQQEIDEENNAICVEETSDDMLEDEGMSQSM